jgi:hypothetical protein
LRGTRDYLPEEIAYVVMRLEQGVPLSGAATELGRDRCGLFRVLKAMGYPTRPEPLDPLRRRAEVAQQLASLKSLSRDEIKARILQLRRQTR